MFAENSLMFPRMSVEDKRSSVPAWAAHGLSALYAPSLAVKKATVPDAILVAVWTPVPFCHPAIEASVGSNCLHHFHLLPVQCVVHQFWWRGGG